MVTRVPPVYCDSDMPNDFGNGGTPETAKKYLGSAYSAAAATGGVVLLRLRVAGPRANQVLQNAGCQL